MRKMYFRFALLRSRIIDSMHRRWYIHPFHAIAIEAEFENPGSGFTKAS